MEINKSRFTQPSGLWMVSFCIFLFSSAQGWVQGMLVIYLISHFNFSSAHAFAVLGGFFTLLFMMPLIGGSLMDKFGKLETIICGTCFTVVGMLLICIVQYDLLLLGLALVLVGVGLALPSYFCSAGALYKKNDVRRDGGFTWIYMIMNAGFFISLLIGAFLAKQTSYSFTTGLFAFVVLFSVILYIILNKKISRQYLDGLNYKQKISKKAIITLSFIAVILSALSLLPLLFSVLDYYFVVLILIGAVLGGFYILTRESTQKAKQKIILFYILCFLAVIFWIFYFLEPTLLTIFSRDNLNLHVLGISFPPKVVFNLDSFFVMLTGLFLARLWVRLEAKNKSITLPTKFTIAPLWVAVGYGVLILAVYFNRDSLMSAYWMVIAYFFFTLGELFIAPIGFSMAGKLAPEGREGFFMGVWQVSIGSAATIASIMGAWLVVPDKGSLIERNTEYMHAFILFAGIGLMLFIIAAILLPWMKGLLSQN